MAGDSIEPFDHLKGSTNLEKLWWAEAEIERLTKRLIELQREKDEEKKRLLDLIEDQKSKRLAQQSYVADLLKIKVGKGKK